MGLFSFAAKVAGVALAASLISDRKAEAEKRESERLKRINTPFNYSPSISKDDFECLVRKCAKRIKRIESLEINGPFILGVVSSQSGISEWKFKLDFNDWGCLTGAYWIWQENDDSQLPQALANKIVEEITRLNK
jgi:hypothetical protein